MDDYYNEVPDSLVGFQECVVPSSARVRAFLEETKIPPINLWCVTPADMFYASPEEQERMVWREVFVSPRKGLPFCANPIHSKLAAIANR